jgi:hypothetical protein
MLGCAHKSPFLYSIIRFRLLDWVMGFRNSWLARGQQAIRNEIFFFEVKLHSGPLKSKIAFSDQF